MSTKHRLQSHLWLRVVVGGGILMLLILQTFLHGQSLPVESNISQVKDVAPVDSSLTNSLNKLYGQISSENIAAFDRNRPIYIDMGMNDARDTELYLSKGYSTVSVDAYKPWVTKAQEKFQSQIKEHRALFFYVGVGLHDAEPMPLFFKQEGSVIASFESQKGCQFISATDPKCMHIDVPVVRCDAILHIIGAQAEFMKVDVEMLHHACIRRLHSIDTSILPKLVCWEEHDKPFGPARNLRPITDAKLILGMHELGYNDIKIVMQGPAAANFYGLDKHQAGTGSGSGTLGPDDMMHYRSYEDNEDGSFDTNWRTVNFVLRQGVFGAGAGKPRSVFEGRSYYDVCMKLGGTAAKDRVLRANEESLPLSSYHSMVDEK